MTPQEQEQLKKDRRTLVRGATLTAAGGLAAYAVLRKAGGPIQRGPATGLPAPAAAAAAPKVKARPVVKSSRSTAAAANNVRKGGAPRLAKAADLRETRAWGALRPASSKGVSKLSPAARQQFLKMDAAARKASLKTPPAGTVTPGELRAADRGARQRARQDLLVFRKKKNFATPFMNLFADRSEKLKNTAVGAGALASGGASIYAARKVGQAAASARATSDAARAAIPRFTPREVAAAIGADVKAKTKKTLKSYFPTFIKGGKKISALMKRHAFAVPKPKPLFEIYHVKSGSVVGKAANRTSARKVLDRRDNAYGGYAHAIREIVDRTRRSFSEPAMTQEEMERRYGRKPKAKVKTKSPRRFSTPASRLIEFGGYDQMKEVGSRRYANPLSAAAGITDVYTKTDTKGRPIREDVPLAHGQVIRAAYNKGKKIQRTATRGGALLKDVGHVVTGKPREKDAAGRTKKREWEKSWFKDGVRNVATAGALVGGAAYLRKNPSARKKVVKRYRKATAWVNKKVPDLAAVTGFSTPASKILGRFEKSLRKGPLGKFMGPSARSVAVQAQRESLGKKIAGMKGGKAARVGRAVKRDASLKKDAIHAATRRQKDAVRGAKKAGTVAGIGALAGGAAMKLHADQPEDRKVHQGARFRNALIGSAAGSMLGGSLAGGRSGFRGARVGAALGGVIGAVSNPKRKQIIEELPLASFSTPASSLFTLNSPPSTLNFDASASDAGWDIRDPRGKSARVFAPGSRQRVRREKEWYERKSNRDKLAAAAVVASGLGGLALGTKLGKKLALRKKPPVAAPAGYSAGPKMGPRSTPRREAFRSTPGSRPRG